MSCHPIPVENVPADRAQIARVLVKANFEDAYYRTAYSFAPLPFLIENARLRLGSNLLNARGWFMKIVSPEEEQDRDDGLAHASASDGEEHGTGKGEIIVSYARWLLPTDVKEKLEKEFPRVKLSEKELEEVNADRAKGCKENGEPNGLNEEMIQVVGKAKAEAEAEAALPTHRPHMYLDLIATLPTHQRRGLATAHVKWGVDLANKESLPIFLVSTPPGKGLYEKFGFKEVSRATHRLATWGGEGLYTHTFMVREPEVVQV